MDVFESIREAAKKNALPMEEFRAETYGHSDFWPIDRINAVDYFVDKPEILELILKYLKEHEGEIINHFDIAGRSTFNSESEKIMTNVFYFVRSRIGRKEKEGECFIEGDIMEDVDFRKALLEINKKGLQFDIVTFQPVGGLDEYSPDKISDQIGLDEKIVKLELMKIFLKRLYGLKSVLKDNGLLYLGDSYLLSEYYKNNENTFRKLFKKLGFEVIAQHKSYTGLGKDKSSSFLLKKIS